MKPGPSNILIAVCPDGSHCVLTSGESVAGRHFLAAAYIGEECDADWVDALRARFHKGFVQYTPPDLDIGPPTGTLTVEIESSDGEPIDPTVVALALQEAGIKLKRARAGNHLLSANALHRARREIFHALDLACPEDAPHDPTTQWSRRCRPDHATTTQCDWVNGEGYCCRRETGHEGQHLPPDPQSAR